MQAFTIENDVLAGVIGPVGPGDTTISLRAPVAPFRAPPAPLDSGRPGVLTIVDRLSMPTAIEVITYTTRTINGDGSVTLGGVTRGLQGTTGRAWTNAAQAYQAPTRDQLQQTTLGAQLGSVADAAAARALIGAGTGNGTITGVGVDAPLQSTGGASPTLSMPAATAASDGHMTSAQAAKLNGIAAGAQVNVGTNLAVGGSGNARTLTSSTGDDADLPLSSGAAAGLMSLEQHTKLAGIATGATAYTNAMVRAQIESMLQNGTNVTFSFSGSGDSRALTINASGGGVGGSPGGPDRSIQFNNAGAFAGSEQLTWSADFTGLVVPAVYGFDRVFVTSVIDPEVGTAAVATETMAVSEVEGVASWQLQLRSRDGGGLVRMRLRSDDVGPQIAFGSGDFVGFWHAENFDPTQGPEVETVAGTTYDFVNSDSGKYKRATATGAKTFVVDATVTKPRWECHVHNSATSGNLTIAGDGVTINAVADGSVILPPGAFATMRRTAAGEFEAQAVLVQSVAGRIGAVVLSDADVPATVEEWDTTTKTTALADRGKYIYATATGAKTLTFDTVAGGADGEYHYRNDAESGDLTLIADGVTLKAPKGGTLVLEPGDTVTVKRVESNVLHVFGSTKAA
jgi:hypothetical protein